ncbi:hypothetical protein [Pseudomonas phage vB_Pae_CF177a]|nr:hypothetical protein [Pseudomonas phage vB_Pae_CF177a]
MPRSTSNPRLICNCSELGLRETYALSLLTQASTYGYK